MRLPPATFLLANAALAAALHVSTVPRCASASVRRCAHPRAAAEGDDLDLGLLKLPRLVRPAEASIEAFKKRRNEWSDGRRTYQWDQHFAQAGKEVLIPEALGDDTLPKPTSEQKAQANAEFEELLGPNGGDPYSSDVDDMLGFGP